jgi:hypothetical protein
MPNHQSQVYGSEGMPLVYISVHWVRLIQNSLHASAMSAPVLLVGPSLTYDQFPDLSFSTDPNDADTPHAASTQYTYPASWRGANRRMEQTETENHNPLSSHRDIYGACGVYAPPESSYMMNAGTSSSLSPESYTEPGEQDDYADATSFPPGQVEGAALNLVAIQGQNATTQEASSQRERKVIEKRERDKARKKIERNKDAQDYAGICELLEIRLTPRNTLAHRSECLCIHPRQRY